MICQVWLLSDTLCVLIPTVTEYDDMVISHYRKFVAEMNDTVNPDGAAEHRHKRDTTVESYYVELLFILDHTIYE